MNNQNYDAKLNRWLNRYTAQIQLEVPTSNLSEIPVYDIPHPSKIDYKASTAILTWYVKGHFDSTRALSWYNDIVTKINLCLDGRSLISGINNTVKPDNNIIYELQDFKSVEDMRYWKGKKIFIPIVENTVGGDEQFNKIRKIAYALKKKEQLTYDNLMLESVAAIGSESYFKIKHKIKNVYRWTSSNYNARSKRIESTKTRTQQAQLNNETISKRNYNKVKGYYELCSIKGIKPTVAQAMRVIKLSKNTILKYLKQLPILGNQTRRAIRGIKGELFNSLLLDQPKRVFEYYLKMKVLYFKQYEVEYQRNTKEVFLYQMKMIQVQRFDYV